MYKQAIVFGNDHTNTLGVIQALGREGIKVDALLYGEKTGIIKSSKYINKILGYENPDLCIKALLELKESQENGNKKRIPIIPTADTASLYLQKHKDDLNTYFTFAKLDGNYNIYNLLDKSVQVKIANEVGLKVPLSKIIASEIELEKFQDFEGPYLIKTLISLKGTKSDIQVCKDLKELKEKASLVFKKYQANNRSIQLLVQQFIEHDYEISLLGVSCLSGEVFLPAIENKLTQFPLYVGLECKAEINAFEDKSLKDKLIDFIKTTGYKGLFSIEMMHSIKDGNFYFTELNLRNDGANSFLLQSGINLPYCHYNDLQGMPLNLKAEVKRGCYLWETHHLQSLKGGAISLKEWLQDIKNADGYLAYVKDDKKPFFKIMRNLFLSKFKIVKSKTY